MRVPSGRYVHRYIRLIILFIFGMLMGMIIFLFIYGQQLDRLQLRVRQLETQNVQYLEKIVNMEKTEKLLKSRFRLTVKSIEIHPQAANAFIATESTRLLLQDLSFLKERPLDDVANFHDALKLMLAGRRYTIANQSFAIQLKTLVISETLHFYVEVVPIQ